MIAITDTSLTLFVHCSLGTIHCLHYKHKSINTVDIYPWSLHPVGGAVEGVLKKKWPHPEEKCGALESPKGNDTTVCRHKHPTGKMPSMHKAPLVPPSASTEGAATEGALDSLVTAGD